MKPFICQNSLPFFPWMDSVTNRLPGIQPLGKEPVFIIDEVFRAQMKYREFLLNNEKDTVLIDYLQCDKTTNEVLSYVKNNLKKNKKYKFKKTGVIRPDGKEVVSSKYTPLEEAARLVQEDLLVLKKIEEQYFLKAGALCFPASWLLSEKINRNMTKVHSPVKSYTEKISKSVDRMLNNLKPTVPIWRANWLLFDRYDLFLPEKESSKRIEERAKNSKYIRVERQTLTKLKHSETILFTIHTFVMPFLTLSLEQRQSLNEQMISKF